MEDPIRLAWGEAASNGTERRLLGKAGVNDGKSALAKRPAQPPIHCPNCGSDRTWRDGLRWTRIGWSRDIYVEAADVDSANRRFTRRYRSTSLASSLKCLTRLAITWNALSSAS